MRTSVDGPILKRADFICFNLGRNNSVCSNNTASTIDQLAVVIFLPSV